MELKPGYKQTEVGVIPEDWEAATMNDVATFSGGSQPVRSLFRFSSAPGYIRLIQIRDYKTDEYASYIPESTARKQCTAEDIMIGRYGPPIFQILRGIAGAYNVALIKATPRTNIDREFLFNVLQQNRLFQLIDSLSRRSSGQTGVEMPALRAYGLPLPSLPEQRAVVEALSHVDALLGALDRLIAKKRDLKQAAMQQLLIGQTRLLGFHGEWNQWSISQVSPNIIDYRGRTPLKLGMEWGGGDIPALSAKNVKMGFIDLREETNYGSESLYKRWMNNGDAQKDDVVITTEAPLGNVALIPDTRKYILSQRTLLLKVAPLLATTKFLVQLMMGDDFQKLLSENSSGSTAKGIQRRRFEKLKLVLPEVAEQTAIAEVLTDMDAEIAGLEQRREKTHALKQAMMQELLTGKTRLI